MNYFRFWLGRHLIHLGLAVWPDGKCKREVDGLLRRWGEKVKLVTE